MKKSFSNKLFSIIQSNFFSQCEIKIVVLKIRSLGKKVFFILLGLEMILLIMSYERKSISFYAKICKTKIQKKV